MLQYINQVLLLCVFVLCPSVITTIKSDYDDDSVHVSQTLDVVKGGVASIPCNISLHTLRDKVQTVVWYKGVVIRRQTSIYTFDARDTDLKGGNHWSDPILAGRASFHYQENPPKLILKEIKESDGGIYICRVDYEKSPSQHYKVNVTIILPPEKLLILDEKGGQINHHVAGPYNEGDLANITCVAFGGRPTPNITWWKENTLIDSISEFISKKRIKNTLHLDRIQRKDLHTVLTCQASNNNLALPISSSITLEMNLRPLWAKIWGKQRVLSAGTPYELSCEVVGSRPRPIITWWLGGVQMFSTRELTSASNNSTTSFLTFIPAADDHRKHISCKGSHPTISDCLVEDGWSLNVYHIPWIKLNFDATIDANDVHEGSDVRLNCDVTSNPPFFTTNWQYNDEEVQNNPSSGMVVANQSLIVKNVDRSRNGNYTCTATNLEGIGESNTLRLDVKYTPRCHPGQTKIHRIAIHNRADIPCNLDANPSDVQFTWKFKYSDGNVLALPEHYVSSNGTTSTVHYTPTADDDFPLLLCSGRNSVGLMDQPCIFHLLPINSPEAPNCKVTKQTDISLHVECIDEFNRGIRGEFIMEVYDSQTGKLVRNVTSRDPTFTVRGLESGIGFDVDLYVVNKDGKSLVTRLPTFTLTAEKYGHAPPVLSVTTLLYILVGVVGVLILLAIAIVTVIRCRGDPESCEDMDFNGFQVSSRYMPMGSDKFIRPTASNTSYDSFDTESPNTTT